MGTCRIRNARLLAKKPHAHGFSVETWVIHEPRQPMKSIQQVDLFQDKRGRWTAWVPIPTGGRGERGKKLARARNRCR